MNQSERTPVLHVESLSVQFRGTNVQLSAVENASFIIFQGEVVGVLGESGSGKTSVGSAIIGLLPPTGTITSGSIRFKGEELVGIPDEKMRVIRGASISTISQEPRIALNPVMRVGVQIAEVIRAHKRLSSAECREEVLAILKQVRLDPEIVYSAFPHELSGGQCQRVAIAQALVCRPQLVIADEPTSSLDTTVQAEILALLSDFSRRLNVAFLLITHNPAILAKFADRILVMHAGRIVEQGKTTDIIRRPTHPYTRSLLSSRAEMIRTTSAGDVRP